MQSPPAACSIAGSDSGGGAGIQADLKTFTALGVWGTTVVTAVTAQNTRGMLGISLIPEEMVALQICAVLDDFDIKAFKTGMLGTAAIIRTVAENVPPGIPLVVDPVMVATSGSRLLEPGAEQELVGTLLPRTTVITPNVPETIVLSKISPITSIVEMKEAAYRIRDLGPDYVIIKGGHLGGEEAVDLLFGPGIELFLTSHRYPYSVHGSGCCLSAAIAAYLALGYTVEEAYRRTKEFMDAAIRSAVESRSGNRSVNPGQIGI